MNLTGVSGNFPAAVKTPGAPASALGITVQFAFSESATIPLTDGAGYSLYLVDSTGANALVLFLDDLDNVFLQAGPVGGSTQYTGTWTPNNGAHVVSLSVDGLGVPTLQIDAEVITLTPGASIPVGIGTLANNTVSFFFTNEALDPDPHFMSVSDVFVTAGALPAGTDFCCPA